MNYKIGFIFEPYFPKQTSTDISSVIKPEDAIEYMRTGLKVEGIILDRGKYRPDADTVILSVTETQIFDDFPDLKYVQIVLRDGSHKIIQI